ncbi:RHS repeat-associated core domain-containing protein [Streptomyces sp. ISL-98]|uniref:RHS repeat domain-containing protein n=1 Tax=Streptomyces sp. ISL-98 TaxID=2819192 RepID=UPI0027E4D132|nr:RHS repeat-associated core domain-containing protein [Streptomyces sp. ISL-98]
MTSASRGGRPHAALRRWLGRGALAVSLALVPQLIVPTGYDFTSIAEAATREFPDPPKPKIDRVLPFTAKKHATPKDQAAPAARKTRERLDKTRWPKAGSTSLSLGTAKQARHQAGGLPVTLMPTPVSRRTAAKASDSATAVEGAVKVRLHDRKTAQKTGVNGVLLTLSPEERLSTGGKLRFSLNYSSFSDAYGGSFGTRLKLIQLPACALTTPNKPSCTTQKPLASTNNPVKQTLTVDLQPAALASAQPMLLAAAASASGGGGDFGATPLGPSATWEAGGSTGDFTWNYPLRMPPSNGPAPSLALSYNSASVDGRTAAENNQTSTVGEGFSFTESYIERKYAVCKDDSEAGKSDLCWKYANATLVLNGKATELVNDCDTTAACTAAAKSEDTGGTWRLKNDDASKVEHLVGASNGDNNGEYWKVTTPDGTQYYFGKHKLPGWSDNGTATDDPVTDSAWTVPVFGNNTGEPCHGTDFNASGCTQAWKWNLDYVVDTHGNAMSHWYGKETNNYAKSGVADPGTKYVRGGYLKRVDYGQRDGHLFDQKAAQRVTLNYAQRCIVTDGCTSLTEATKQNWPDVPFDQICGDGKACTGLIGPSFFTRYRMASMNTYVWDTGNAAYRNIDNWTFNHSFPDTGDASSPSLWLTSITAKGKAGADVDDLAMPSVTFGSVQMPNHVEGGDTLRYIKHRIRTIASETGAKIEVNYSDPQCIRGTKMPTAADDNSLRCFPVYYSQSGATPELDWFHKYVTTSVTQYDTTGAGEPQESYYTYDGGAGWAYSDDEGLSKEKYRTWSQWRGYPKVTTTIGDTTGPRGKTVSRYMRGLDGDKKLTAGTTRDEKVTDSTGTTIEDSRQYAGFVRETITYNGNDEVGGTIHDPWSHSTAKHPYNWGTTEAFFVQSGTVRARQTTASGTRTLKTTTEYDTTYGMPTRVNEHGDVDKTGDETCNTTSYARNTKAWIVDTPSRVESYAAACGTTPSLPKDSLADTTIAYDNQAVGTIPTKGDATATYRVSGYTLGKPDYQKASATAFDALGRSTATTDAVGRTTKTAFTPNDTGYGPLTKTVVTDPKGFITTTESDPAWGAATKSIDPNGKTTEWAYDSLGRVTSVWKPNRSRTLQDTASIRYAYSITKDKASWVRTDALNADGTSYNSAYQIYDAMLRPRQQQTPAANGGRVISETLYDDRGLGYLTNADIHDTTAPTGALANTLPGSTPASTETVYDGAGRATSSVFKVYDQEKWRTSTAHQGDRVANTAAPGGMGTMTIANAQGKTIERREYAGPDPTGSNYTTTKYTYTPRGEIDTITGPDNAKWTYTYDLRGRAIETTDPDKGKTTSAFNHADQVLSTTTTVDGQPKTLLYDYDELGRTTATWDGTKDNAHQLTKHTYDTVAKGLPSSSIRYVGGTTGKIYASQITGYDALYKPTSVKTVLAATDPLVEEAKAPQTFTTSTAYNWDGTVQNTALPAVGGLPAETVAYSYNPLGMPTGVQGSMDYVRSVGYSPLGEVEETLLGTSTTAKQLQILNRYEDGTRRLTNTHTLDQTNAGYTSDTDYAYDPSGNVTSVTNKAGDDDTQCFNYDGHRRLTEAWTPASGDCAQTRSTTQLGGPAPYWNSWTYKTGGLRATQTVHTTSDTTTTNYAYPPVNATGGGQPHTLTSTTAGTKTSSYEYDELGRTIERPGPTAAQTLTYNAEGKLAKTTEGATTTDYLYDANGSVLIRRGTNNTVLYLPGGQELHYDAATKKFSGQRYYSAGDGTALRTNTGLNWVIDDHHGTASMTVDATTQKITRRYTKPFGENRGTNPIAWPDDKGFLGKPADTTTGLTHIGAREYDPAIGRFLTVDPILAPEDHESLNGYAYANNTPVTLSDPTGLRPDGACGGSGSCVVGKTKKGEPKYETWTYEGNGGWSWGWYTHTQDTFTYQHRSYTVSGTVTYNRKRGYTATAERPVLKAGPKRPAAVFHGYAMGTNPNYDPSVADETARPPLSTLQKVLLGVVTAVGLVVAVGPVIGLATPPCLAAPYVCATIGAEALTGGAGTAGGVAAGSKAVKGLQGAQSADNVVNGQRLARQLAQERAGSIFTKDGSLTPEALQQSRKIIGGEEIGNAAVQAEFAKRGGAHQWGKWTTARYPSPHGMDFEVHFYRNHVTGEVLQYDYKVKLPKSIQE